MKRSQQIKVMGLLFLAITLTLTFLALSSNVASQLSASLQRLIGN